MAKLEPLNADLKRQAGDSIRGYLYQHWQAVHAWLDLKEDECLYLEGAEDFDILKSDVAKAVQVKNTSGNITLQSDSVIDAIVNYWSLLKNNKNKTEKIEFCFLTTSKITIEKSNIFKNEGGGLSSWQRCNEDSLELEKLITYIRTDEKYVQKLPSDFNYFLNNNSTNEIYNKIIKPIIWITNSNNIEEVKRAVERKLIYYGHENNIPPDVAKRVSANLFEYAFSTSTKKKRFLYLSDFLEIFGSNTTIPMPINYLNNLPDLMNQILKNSFQGEKSTFGIDSQVSKNPKIDRCFVYRKNFVEKSVTILKQTNCLIINGATGIGKSTLAKQIADDFNTDWNMYFMTENKINEVKRVLRSIVQCKDKSNIIIDNLNLRASDWNNIEPFFAGIVHTLKSRRIMLIITTQVGIPSKIKRLLNDLDNFSVTPNSFNLEEIKEFCKNVGSPEDKSGIYATKLFLFSSRHPQLVHAGISNLKERGWPLIEGVSLFDVPQAIVDEKNQARQLLYILNDQQRELLYLCSILSQPFNRNDIVALGEIYNIQFSGDVFDSLVGPWIEKLIENYYTISPLIRGSASDVWSNDKIKKIHFEYSTILLKNKTINQETVNAILFHGLAGKNEWALIKIAMAINDVPEKYQKQIAESCIWFTFINVDSELDILYPDNLYISNLLRLAQFKLAFYSADYQKVNSCLNAWENELEKTSADKMSSFIYIETVLFHVQVPLPFKRVVTLIIELHNLRNEFINDNELKQFTDDFSIGGFIYNFICYKWIQM